MNSKDFESNENIIVLDNVIKWVDKNKAMVKKTLIKSYYKKSYFPS